MYSLKFTNNIIGFNETTLTLIFGTIITFIINYYTFYFARISFRGFVVKKTKPFESVNSSEKIESFLRIIKKITFIWLAGTFIEIVLFKGIPFISVVLLGNYSLNYSTFGIPTIHGLLNACYYTITASFFLHYLITKDKKSLFKVLILLTWPILVMSRAVLLWVLVEIFCMFLLMRKIRIMTILKILVVFLFVIVLFGYLGDNRSEAVSNNNFTSNFVNTEYMEVANRLPSGFVWIYLYVTTPINNIVWSINDIQPTYNFEHTLISLVPSFIRDNMQFFQASSNRGVALYEEAFNVSSYFANFLNDFGLIGSVFFIALLQIFIVKTFFSAKFGKFGSMIAYAAIFNAVFMSVFYDFFFSLVTVFQLLLGAMINYLLYTKSNKESHV
jgi:oligosaccharide repeat unit polymerase